MRLTKISLTNFRSFKETQTIEIAPVTLLFGPNSVGKSSILMALFYIQQILSKGQCDPHRIESLGDKFVGGFKNLVCGRDINSSIILKLEYDKLNQIGSSYTYLSDIFSDQIELSMSNPASDTEKVAIEIEISWSKSENTAYISRYAIWLNKEFIAEISSDQGLKQPLLTKLNYMHPALIPIDFNDWLVQRFDEGADIHEAWEQDVYNFKGIEVPTHRDISKGAEWPPEGSDEWPDFTEDCFVTQFHELLNDGRLTSEHEKTGSFLNEINLVKLLHVPFGIDSRIGALPVLGRPLVSSLNLDEEQENEVVNEILSDILVAPLDNLLALLNDSLCIGPLRSIPDATSQTNPYPEAKDWHNGLAAWDILAKAELPLLQSIHDWISDDQKLGLGYGIALKVEKQYSELKSLNSLKGYESIDKQLSQMITVQLTEGQRKVEFDESKTQFTYALWDSKNKIDVTASDVGVGVSQLMPLIVAALYSKKGLVAIEQPELHVHPRVQVGVGDLLTQINSPVSFLVETHSEHLILRILKRIRQTSDTELPEGFKSVKPEDVSVVYLEPSEQGVVASRFDVTDDGDFHKDWPDGFFDERDEELF